MQLAPAGPLRVRMGDAVAVECRATGRPRPVLTWKRQGSTLQLLPRLVNDTNVLQVRVSQLFPISFSLGSTLKC